MCLDSETQIREYSENPERHSGNLNNEDGRGYWKHLEEKICKSWDQLIEVSVGWLLSRIQLHAFYK